MPCHVDEIPAEIAKNEIDKLVLVVKGRITFREMGSSFSGEYPNVKELVKQLRRQYKTFHYRLDGTMMVVVSPCPKKC